MPKKSRTSRKPKTSQMMAPAPSAPERLMDGKTFVFNEFITISAPMLSGSFTSLQLNAGVNGWYYTIYQGGSIVQQVKSLWGTTLNQFNSLSLLYETYTVLDIAVELVPSFPSVAYVATGAIVATQTAEDVSEFFSPIFLGSQATATTSLPLAKCNRKLAYQYFLQQNAPSPYLNTYDSSTNQRQVWDASTGQPTLPILSFAYDYYGQITSSSGSDVPIMILKTTTRMHFRGRQNEFFTPASIANRLLRPQEPKMPLDLTKREEKEEEVVTKIQPPKDPDLSLLLSFVKYKQGQQDNLSEPR